jgi:hypothetical protein
MIHIRFIAADIINSETTRLGNLFNEAELLTTFWQS